MRILVCDPISDEAVNQFKEKGFEIDVKTGLKEEELVKIAPEYEVMIVRSATKIRKPVIDSGVNLKILARGGVGLDNIDVDYARSKGIKVVNTPAASSVSVAELALAHLFAVYRFLPQSNVTMRQGEWNKKAYKGRELTGKTIGIIGFGRIGQELAKRADALGMKVIAHDMILKESPLDFVEMKEKDELLSTSHVISLHIPFIKEQGPAIGKRELTLMKKDAVLINCARGGVVDEEALLEALNEDRIWGAGIDVFAEEPTKNGALVNHPKVSVTPHIGASTKEAQDKVGEELVKVIVKTAQEF